jgi:sterol desaturase/sphingolipid hydroxylase (fatty acid hydroxylase superfamily)
MIKRLHFDHHEKPTDLHLLFLPLWFSIPSFAITILLAFWITSNLVLTIAFATGLIGYFLFYEWKHFVAHKPLQPLTKLGKEIKKAHLWHHFKNENYWYGVTHTTIDKTFGTFKDQTLVEKSETARNLEKRV